MDESKKFDRDEIESLNVQDFEDYYGGFDYPPDCVLTDRQIQRMLADQFMRLVTEEGEVN